MKKHLLNLIFCTIIISAAGQSTWVQKLTYNYLTGGYPNILTGVKKIEIGPDGSLFVLANIDDHHSQMIYKFFPNSHSLEWEIFCGYNSSAYPTWVDEFRATSDSGIIVCINASALLSGTIAKYSKDGNLQWQHSYPWSWSSFNYGAHDVLEKNSGGYYALIEDSLFTFDVSGHAMDSTGAVSGTRFLEADNGDLLVLTAGNTLVREDILGNVIWSQICTGLFAYDTTSVFIQKSVSSVQKVDAMTGAQLWSRNYSSSPISQIEATYDGGFIASVGNKPEGPNGYPATPMNGVLFRVDSLGDTLWTRTYTLPHFGLPTVKRLPNGSLCTGGCYFSGSTEGGAQPSDYSAFCCMMNADGSYPLQQTGYVGAMDANHDYVSDFIEDALEVMLGLGQTGPARDTSLDGRHPSSCENDDIAIDWTTFTNSGVNRKHSDWDGNGIIDTNDIQLCNMYVWQDSFPAVYRTQGIEDFCLIPVMDTINPGDPALFYMIMGNSVNPVDSIYGFAFNYNIDPAGNNSADAAFAFNSDFGTPGVDLFLNHRNNTAIFSTSEYRSRTLLCRTNFQNATNVYDTIGMVRFVPASFFPDTITPIIRRFKAIRVDGTDIPFNTCTGSVYMRLATSVEENAGNAVHIKIYPNPNRGEFKVEGLKYNVRRIEIVNILGEKVFEKELPLTAPSADGHVLAGAQSDTQRGIEISLDVPFGVYFVKVETDGYTAVRKLVVE